jgi:hypothetical protein
VQLVVLAYDGRCAEVPDVRLMDVMKDVYALLLALLGFVQYIRRATLRVQKRFKFLVAQVERRPGLSYSSS